MFEMQSIKHDLEIKGFNSIYYFEFGKNFSHSPEKHDFWEMVYVDNGRINAISNGIGCILKRGQAIFHEPSEIHAHVSDKHVANNMVVVSFTTHSKSMRFLRGKTFTLDKTAKSLLSFFLREAKNVLGEIPNDYENKEKLSFQSSVFGAQQLLQSYFTEFLIRLIRSESSLGEEIPATKETRDIATNSMNELITQYLTDNIYSNLTLKDLCNHFLIGKTQICKIFNETTGQSPMSYYQKLKIAEAKKLLREKNYSVTEISDMLGYSSIHTFSRAFKKAAGFSPTAYSASVL